MFREVIRIEKLSKFYRLGLIGGGTLQDDLSRKWAKFRGKPDPLMIVGEDGHNNRDGEYIWALRDINLEVKQGEILGIIGKNGSGKSTLLKILSKITAPTQGRVLIKGRVGSLLEVGTGFHPELTGKENIYLNGAILGMTQDEINGKIDEIIDFSGVELYIDTPTKRYSSGMLVRLAFAVAAHLDPEILMIDEVLAVGDASFQKKCIAKMKDISQLEGRTILFVSHNMEAVRNLCTRAILLKNGFKISEGNTEEIIKTYIIKAFSDDSNGIYTQFNDRDGSGELRINRIEILDENGNSSTGFYSGDEVIFNMYYKLRNNLSSLNDLRVVIDLHDAFGRKIFRLVNQNVGSAYNIKNKSGCFRCTLPKLPLSSGKYYLTIFIMQISPLKHIDTLEQFGSINVENGDYFGSGIIDEWPEMILVDQSWEHIE
jgi:lipopolysaccharide transport system ATP-binding protein